jgi:hypothetical protein
MDDFGDNPQLAEARRYIERAIGGVETMHLGPLDYNVFQTADYLRTAAALIEQFYQNQK